MILYLKNSFLAKNYHFITIYFYRLLDLSLFERKNIFYNKFLLVSVKDNKLKLVK